MRNSAIALILLFSAVLPRISLAADCVATRGKLQTLITEAENNRCAFAPGKGYACDDGDQFANDEGEWRTQQLRAVRALLTFLEPIAQDSGQKACLDGALSGYVDGVQQIHDELGQISLTGAWEGSVQLGMIDHSLTNLSYARACNSIRISINRVQRSVLRMSIRYHCNNYYDFEDFDYELGFDGTTLAWGQGTYCDSAISLDLRLANYTGKLYKLSLRGPSYMHYVLDDEVIGVNSSDFIGDLRRLDSTPEGSLPPSPPKPFVRRFEGRWRGRIVVDGFNSLEGGAYHFDCEDVTIEISEKPYWFTFNQGNLNCKPSPWHFDHTTYVYKGADVFVLDEHSAPQKVGTRTDTAFDLGGTVKSELDHGTYTWSVNFAVSGEELRYDSATRVEGSPFFKASRTVTATLKRVETE